MIIETNPAENPFTKKERTGIDRHVQLQQSDTCATAAY